MIALRGVSLRGVSAVANAHPPWDTGLTRQTMRLPDHPEEAIVTGTSRHAKTRASEPARGFTRHLSHTAHASGEPIASATNVSGGGPLNCPSAFDPSCA